MEARHLDVDVDRLCSLDVEHLYEQVAGYLKRTDEFNRPDVQARWRGACLIQKKIYDVVGGVIEQCKDLIREVLLYYNYLDVKWWGDVFIDLSLFDNVIDKVDNGDIHFDIRFIVDLLDYKWQDVQLYEGFTEEQYNEAVEKLHKYGCKEMVISSPLEKYCLGGSFSTYYNYHNDPEYWLCRQIRELCEPDIDFGKVAYVVFLFIALETEKEKIKDEAAVQGVQLTEPATDAPELSQEAMKPSGRATAPKPDKTASQIEIAKPYFERAIAERMMTANDDGTYNWKLKNIDLAYFLIKIFEPKQPPYSTFEPLFVGIKGLSKSWYNYTQTYKYKDGKQSQAQKDIDYIIDYVKDDTKEQGNQ